MRKRASNFSLNCHFQGLRNEFKDEDLARYEKRKDGKLFKRWLQRKEEELNDANDKCNGCKSVAETRTGLIKKGLGYLWEEFKAWLEGIVSSDQDKNSNQEESESDRKTSLDKGKSV